MNKEIVAQPGDWRVGDKARLLDEEVIVVEIETRHAGADDVKVRFGDGSEQWELAHMLDRAQTKEQVEADREEEKVHEELITDNEAYQRRGAGKEGE